MRGWIEVHDGNAAPDVRLAVEFPQMFTASAHHRTFALDSAALERLLGSEREGTFEYTLDEKLGWSD